MSHFLPIATSIDRKAAADFGLLSNLVNRHGCITGATGTGKTVTLQVIAQALSGIGVPVFMADVKGDLSGLAQAGAPSPGSMRGSKRSASTRPPGRRARSPSGTCSASRAIRCARRFSTSARCCWRAC